MCHVIKTPKKDELIILGSSLGPKSQAEILEKKIIDLKINGILMIHQIMILLCWKDARKHSDVLFKKALEKWPSLTNEQERPLVGTQKNWTQLVDVQTAQDLISRMDEKRSNVFNARQGNFGSQWMNVVSCKNLGLKVDESSFKFRLVYDSGSTSVLRICATVVKELSGAVERGS